MAVAMLTAAGLSRTLSEVIAGKAEGNPFFVQEVVRALTDASIGQASAGEAGQDALADMVMPDTIQDVLMARIDRLDEASKRLLQLASVIGRDVPLRLLERIAETEGTAREQLRRLTASELIQERAVVPETAYRFNHSLTQEVAYSSLLVQRRVDLHRRIGAGIEELYSDRLAEQYEALAHHFEKGEAWPKALEYILKAADKAARTFATREAIALYQRAEAAADHIGQDVDSAVRTAIHRAKTELFLLVSDFEQARAEGARVLALARRAGDRACEAAALVSMAIASWLDHRFDQALADAREAIAMAEIAQSPSALAGGHLATGLVLEMTGRLAEAGDKFERVIQISRASGDVVNESWALVFAAEIKGWEAAFDEASRLYGAGVRLARDHNILLPLLEGLFMWGINLTGQGEYGRALALLEDGLALARKVGDENYTPRYLNSLGWLHIECGNLDHARELNLRAAEGARARRDDESIANAELNLGDIALITGDLALAGDLLDKVHRQAANPATSEWMRWRYSLHLFASLAEFRLARGDLVKALEFAGHLLELATRTRSRKYLAQGWRLKGEIARARRQWDEGEAALGHALRIAEAIGSPTQLWKTHHAAARLHNGAGRSGAAHAAHQAARAIIDQVKASLEDPTLRASLERAPHIRPVYGSIRERADDSRTGASAGRTRPPRRRSGHE